MPDYNTQPRRFCDPFCVMIPAQGCHFALNREYFEYVILCGKLVNLVLVDRWPVLVQSKCIIFRLSRYENTRDFKEQKSKLY